MSARGRELGTFHASTLIFIVEVALLAWHALGMALVMHGALWANSTLILFLLANSSRWTHSAIVGAAVNATLHGNPLDSNLTERAYMIIW